MADDIRQVIELPVHDEAMAAHNPELRAELRKLSEQLLRTDVAFMFVPGIVGAVEGWDDDAYDGSAWDAVEISPRLPPEPPRPAVVGGTTGQESKSAPTSTTRGEPSAAESTTDGDAISQKTKVAAPNANAAGDDDESSTKRPTDGAIGGRGRSTLRDSQNHSWLDLASTLGDGSGLRRSETDRSSASMLSSASARSHDSSDSGGRGPRSSSPAAAAQGAGFTADAHSPAPTSRSVTPASPSGKPHSVVSPQLPRRRIASGGGATGASAAGTGSAARGRGLPPRAAPGASQAAAVRGKSPSGAAGTVSSMASGPRARVARKSGVDVTADLGLGASLPLASTSGTGASAAAAGSSGASIATSGSRRSYKPPTARADMRKTRARAAKARKSEKKRQAEREREEQERQGMQAEEWVSARAEWWGDSSGDGTWKTVRVFISSTFGDMMGERDALTRNVFPQLNSMIKSRRVRCLPVDLRWGLSKLDTSDEGLGALEHCLLEIEASRPFFLYLAGDRYGWTPPNYRVSDDPRFAWCKTFEAGHSITDLEVQSGFLRKPYTPVHAWMYRRETAFMADVHDEDELRVFRFDYGDDGPEAEYQQQLWDDIEEHPYAKCRTYSCVYGGKDEEGKPHVRGLEQFEKDILRDIYNAICLEFPPPPPPPSALHVERAYHDHFVQQRAASFIGRQSIIDVLLAHANADCTRSSLPFVVVGAPGSGKTSLVCKFAKQFSEESSASCASVVHIVSASPTSTEIREVLLRLCHELVECLQLEWDPANDAVDYQAVKEIFPETLKKAGKAALKRGGRVLVVMDAINQLNPYNSALMVDWFPLFSPPGVKAVLSTTPESPALTALQRRDPAPRQLTVPGLSLEEREEIVVTQLREYRKKLLPSQVQLVLDKHDSFKPLYLLTLVEELRLQAQYGRDGTGVDDKIQEFPDIVPALMDEVLKRIERDISTWAKTSGNALAGVERAILPAHGNASQAAGTDAAASGEDSGVVSTLVRRSSGSVAGGGGGGAGGGAKRPFAAPGHRSGTSDGSGASLSGGSISVGGGVSGRRGSLSGSIASRVTPRNSGNRTFAPLPIDEHQDEEGRVAAESVGEEAGAVASPGRRQARSSSTSDRSGGRATSSNGTAAGDGAESSTSHGGGAMSMLDYVAGETEEESMMRLGRRLVRDALTLLECSRHGLSETELLELLAPPGRERLPPVAWARLFRTLEVYLRPQDEGGEGIIGFFHQQIRFAVRRRYLREVKNAEALVMERLAMYSEGKADPTGDGRWIGAVARHFDDMVFYQLGAMDYRGLEKTLGSIRFIEAKVAFGGPSTEHLLRDYFQAQDALRQVKFALLRDRMSGLPLRQNRRTSRLGSARSHKRGGSRGNGMGGGSSTSVGSGASMAGGGRGALDGDGGVPDDGSATPVLSSFSRAEVVARYESFRVFVSAHQALLAAFPRLTMQFALAQPDDTAPQVAAAQVLESHVSTLASTMETREKAARDRAAFDARRLRRAQGVAQRIALHVRDDLRRWASAGFTPKDVAKMADADAKTAEEYAPDLEGWIGIGVVRKEESMVFPPPPVPLPALAGENEEEAAERPPLVSPWAVTAAASKLRRMLFDQRAGKSDAEGNAGAPGAGGRSTGGGRRGLNQRGEAPGSMSRMRGRRAMRAASVLPGVVVISEEAVVGMVAVGLHPCWPVTSSTLAALEAMPSGVTDMSVVLARLRWELSRVSDGLVLTSMPRRFCEFVNKPRHNRITADFAGYSSEITALAMPPQGVVATSAGSSGASAGEGESSASSGMIIAIGFCDGGVQIADASTGETKAELRVGGHKGAVTTLCFGEDGQRLASGGVDGRVVIWDVSGQSRIAEVTHHTEPVTAAVWIEVGSSKASKARGGKRKTADRRRGRSGGGAPKNSRILLTASMDRSLCLSQEQAAARTGAGAAKASSETVYDLVKRTQMNSNPVLSLAFCPDTLTVATGHVDGRVSVFDARAPRLGLLALQTWQANRLGGIVKLAFSPDGAYICTGSMDGKIRIFTNRTSSGDSDDDGGSGAEAKAGGGGPGSGTGVGGFAPDDRDDDDDAAADVQWREKHVRWQATTAVSDVQFSADGKRVVVSSADRKATLIRVSDGFDELSLSGHSGPITAAQFWPGSSNKLVTASQDKTVKCWDAGGVTSQGGGRLSQVRAQPESISVELMRAVSTVQAASPYGSTRGLLTRQFDDDAPDSSPRPLLGGSSSTRAAPRTVAGGSRHFVMPSTGTGSPRFGDGGSGGGGGSASGFSSPGYRAGRRGMSTPGMTSTAAAAASVITSRTSTRAPRGGHAVKVTAACVCPDGTLRAATGDAEGDIKVWDGSSGDEIAVLIGHASAVTSLHWTRNGDLLLSSDAGGAVFVWDGRRLTHKLTVPVAIGTAVTALTTSTFTQASVEGVPDPLPSKQSKRERRARILYELRQRRRHESGGAVGAEDDYESSTSTGEEDNEDAATKAVAEARQGFQLSGAAAAVMDLIGPMPGTTVTEEEAREGRQRERQARREKRQRLRQERLMAIVGMADGRVVGFATDDGTPWLRLVEVLASSEFVDEDGAGYAVGGGAPKGDGSAGDESGGSGGVGAGSGSGQEAVALAMDSPQFRSPRRTGRRRMSSDTLDGTAMDAGLAISCLRVVGPSFKAVPTSSKPAPINSGIIGDLPPPPPGMAGAASEASAAGVLGNAGERGAMLFRDRFDSNLSLDSGRLRRAGRAFDTPGVSSAGALGRAVGTTTSGGSAASTARGPGSSTADSATVGGGGAASSASSFGGEALPASPRRKARQQSWLHDSGTSDPPEQVRGITPANRMRRLLVARRDGSLRVLEFEDLTVRHSEALDIGRVLGGGTHALSDFALAPDGSRAAMAPAAPSDVATSDPSEYIAIPRLVVAPAATLDRADVAAVRPPPPPGEPDPAGGPDGEDDDTGSESGVPEDAPAAGPGGAAMPRLGSAAASASVPGSSAASALGSTSGADPSATDMGSSVMGAAQRSRGDQASAQQAGDPLPWVTRLSFSMDGTLLAAGLQSREVVVVDPSRPAMGPVCEFVTVGSVSAVAAGHGVLPWPDPDTGAGAGDSSAADYLGPDDRDERARRASMDRQRLAFQRRASIGSVAGRGGSSMRPLELARSSRHRRGSAKELLAERPDALSAMSSMGESGRFVGLESGVGLELDLSSVANAATEVPVPGEETPEDIARAMAVAESAAVSSAAGSTELVLRNADGSQASAEVTRVAEEMAKEHRLRELELNGVGLSEKRLLAGDGDGRVGLVVAGDATGQVFIIALVDVLRVAEARRTKAAIAAQQEARRVARQQRQEAAKKARDAEEEERRRRLETIRHAPPAEALQFEQDALRACAILPPRRLQPSEAKDRRLLCECLAMLGIDVGLLDPHEVHRVREALPVGGDIAGCWAILQAAERRALAILDMPGIGDPASPSAASRAGAVAVARPGHRRGSSGATSKGPQSSAVQANDPVGGPLTPIEEVVIAALSKLPGLARCLRQSSVAAVDVEGAGATARPGRTASASAPVTSAQALMASRPRFQSDKTATAGSGGVGGAGDLRGGTGVSPRQQQHRITTTADALGAGDAGIAGAEGSMDAVSGQALPIIVRGMSAVDVLSGFFDVIAAAGSGGIMPPPTVWEVAALLEVFGVLPRDIGSGLQAVLRQAEAWASSDLTASTWPGPVFAGSVLAGSKPIPSPLDIAPCVALAKHFDDIAEEPPRAPQRPSRPAVPPPDAAPRARARRPVAPEPAKVRAKTRGKVVVAFGRVVSIGGRPVDENGNFKDVLPEAEPARPSAPVKVRPWVDPFELSVARRALLRARFFSRPRALLCVFGGAGGLHDLLVPELRAIIRRGAVTAAIASGAMLLDGGTKAGVMDMVGDALNGRAPGTLRLLGVAPDGVVEKPRVVGSSEGDAARAKAESEKARADAAAVEAATPAQRKDREDESILARLLGERRRKRQEEEAKAAAEAAAPSLWTCPLEPRHSSFILTPSTDWGSETTTMATAIAVLKKRMPTVAVLANGGIIAKQEALTVVRSRAPLIVLGGSGRLADSITKLVFQRAAVEGHEICEMAKARVDASQVVQGRPLVGEASVVASSLQGDAVVVNPVATGGSTPALKRAVAWKDTPAGKRVAEEDASLMEVASYDDLHVLSISEPPVVLQDLILALIDRDRRRLLALSGKQSMAGFRVSGSDPATVRRACMQAFPVPLLVGGPQGGGASAWDKLDRYGLAGPAGEGASSATAAAAGFEEQDAADAAAKTVAAEADPSDEGDNHAEDDEGDDEGDNDEGDDDDAQAATTAAEDAAESEVMMHTDE